MSQPSPSGDELLWEFMAPFIGPTGGWLVSPKKFHAAIADWLRSHDAKVSGQGLKKSLLDMLHNHGCESGPCNACKSARAALQESPSDK